MELPFGTLLLDNLGNAKSDADHIKCSHGPHLARGSLVPHAWYKTSTQKNTLHSSLYIMRSSLTELRKPQIILQKFHQERY